MNAQRTLRRSISCAGIGLHSGNKVTLSLKPAAADSGIRFRRSDLGGLEVPATVQARRRHQLRHRADATNTVKVDTVEHLLAALVSLGIDNVIVELNSPEVPIMDGSAAPFIYLIQEAGVKRLPAPAALPEGPAAHRRCRAATSASRSTRPITSRSPTASPSTIRCCAISRARSASPKTSFVDEIAPARTFGFLKEVEMMRQQGLALGGSLENAIVIGDTGVLNSALRFDDEFVRHKILDVIGDMALVGHPIIGHLVAHRGGHALHTEFAAQVLESRRLELVESLVDAAVGRSGAAIQSRHRAGGLTGSARRLALFRKLPHVRFELVVLVLHGVEEQALHQIRPPLLVVHLVDECVNLPQHVLERCVRARVWPSPR